MKVTMYLDSIPKVWNNIEVSPVKVVMDDVYGNFVEVCDGKDADMWSVYLHDVNGGVQCIADCESEDDAIELRGLLKNAVRSYQENGFL